MRMSEGVEWALHSCLNLAWVGPDQAVTAAKLAAYFDLPAPYLNKHLQVLARASILTSVSGPRGGFRLARPPERISLLDVVVAIEGPEQAFRCREILRQAPDGDTASDYTLTCVISQTMAKAERLWRQELAEQSLADVKAKVADRAPGAPEAARRWFALA